MPIADLPTRCIFKVVVLCTVEEFVSVNVQDEVLNEDEVIHVVHFTAYVGLKMEMGNTVLLMCDFQNDILVSLPPPMREKLVENSRRLLEGAREAGMTIIYVGVCFREG